MNVELKTACCAYAKCDRAERAGSVRLHRLSRDMSGGITHSGRTVMPLCCISRRSAGTRRSGLVDSPQPHPRNPADSGEAPPLRARRGCHAPEAIPTTVPVDLFCSCWRWQFWLVGDAPSTALNFVPSCAAREPLTASVPPPGRQARGRLAMGRLVQRRPDREPHARFHGGTGARRQSTHAAPRCSAVARQHAHFRGLEMRQAPPPRRTVPRQPARRHACRDRNGAFAAEAPCNERRISTAHRRQWSGCGRAWVAPSVMGGADPVGAGSPTPAAPGPIEGRCGPSRPCGPDRSQPQARF
jgi:hypothetical protein